jgi:hypothetical protein
MRELDHDQVEARFNLYMVEARLSALERAWETYRRRHAIDLVAQLVFGEDDVYESG